MEFYLIYNKSSKAGAFVQYNGFAFMVHIWCFHTIFDLVVASCSFNSMMRYFLDPTACDTQKCSRRLRGGHTRAYGLHISGRGGRKHVGVQDLATHSRCCWWLPLFGILHIFLFLSSTIKETSNKFVG